MILNLDLQGLIVEFLYIADKKNKLLTSFIKSSSMAVWIKNL